jgi:hypothetical protein
MNALLFPFSRKNIIDFGLRNFGRVRGSVVDPAYMSLFCTDPNPYINSTKVRKTLFLLFCDFLFTFYL